LVDVDTDEVLWASDSDEDFGEEFPEILDENDVEHLLDYLEGKELLTSRELELCDIITEPLEDEDDDEDGDPDDTRDSWDDSDVIDGEVIES
jgi:hypothetical protein